MKRVKKVNILLLMVICLMLSACSTSSGSSRKLVVGGTATGSNQKNQAEEDSAEDKETDTKESSSLDGVYIIKDFDMEEERLTLYSISNGRQYRYSYNLSTKFQDKYGDRASWSSFHPGEAVEVEEDDLTSALTLVQKSDLVFEYEDVENYSINAWTNVLTIGKTQYQIVQNASIFAGDEIAAITSIGENDTLRIVGYDKEIYSISVTTGHGYLKLLNTDKFNDSLIEVGTKIYATVEPDLLIEVPEGTYQVAVANDGYGGSKEVTIEAGETLELDLSELEGEGPKMCNLTFQVTVTGATIYLDGVAVPSGVTEQVRYGKHSLVIVADGYDTWKKTLYVNSAEATIMLDLSESEESSDTTSDTTSASSSSSDASSYSSTSNSTSSSTDSSTDESDAEVDYLTTLSEMISTLMGTD